MFKILKGLIANVTKRTDELHQNAIMVRLKSLTENRSWEDVFTWLPTKTPLGWFWLSRIQRRIKYIKVYQIVPGQKTNNVYIIWFDKPLITYKYGCKEQIHYSNALMELKNIKLLVDPRIVWEYM